MCKIDWSNIKATADITPEELERLDALSGQKCSCCGKETTIGEDEAFGACSECYDKGESDGN